jgi:hypothetical protein
MRWFVCIALLVVSAVIVDGQEKRPNAASDKNHSAPVQQSPQPPSSIVVLHEEKTEENGDGSKDRSQSYFNRLKSPEVLSNLLLVIVAAVTAGYIKRQAREAADATKAMRDSIDATKAAARARILVRLPTTVLPELIKIMEKDMPYYQVSIPLSHHGSTDALNVKMFGNAFTHKDREVAFSLNEEIYKVPAYIRPEDKTIIAGLTAFYPEEDHAKVESGDLSFHVCGKITYDDIYGEHQETTFWYVWDMEIFDLGDDARHEYQSWKLNGAPEHNHAT